MWKMGCPLMRRWFTTPAHPLPLVGPPQHTPAIPSTFCKHTDQSCSAWALSPGQLQRRGSDTVARRTANLVMLVRFFWTEFVRHCLPACRQPNAVPAFCGAVGACVGAAGSKRRTGGLLTCVC